MGTSKQTSSPRTLSIGGATYDLFLEMGDALKHDAAGLLLPSGGKIRVKGVTETCGGGACNTAVGLARLGLSAGFCGIVGSDQWGERLIATMKKEGVNTASATVVEHETSSFSIILTMGSGERTILYTPGVNEHLHDAMFDVAAIDTCTAVYLNHLSDSSCMIEDDIVKAILRHPDIHLTWNPGGCQIEQGFDAKEKKDLLKVTDLLVLNKEEAMKFSRTGSVKEALMTLSKAGAKHVCITDGKHGVTATDGAKTWHCPVLKDTKIVETTGAGDAFGTGATWALATGKSLPDALKAGTLNAASVVGRIGAQAGLLTDTQMIDALKTVSLVIEDIA